MHKKLLMGLLLLIAMFMVGCSNDGAITLLDEQGKEVAFEGRDNPALVFFFTGVG